MWKITHLDDGNWRCVSTCEQAPHLDSDDVYEMGKEVDVESPMYGGKAKVNNIGVIAPALFGYLLFFNLFILTIF